MVSNSMELVLNLVWLAASVGLGVLLVVSRSKCRAMHGNTVHAHTAAWISYLILVAMLLPAISMSDDLHAMIVPRDGEQVVRRCEAFSPGHAPVQLHGAIFFQVRNLSFAPLPHAMRLEVVRYFHPFCFSDRRTSQGRAPPISV